MKKKSKRFKKFERKSMKICALGLARTKTTPEPEGQKFHIGQRVFIKESVHQISTHKPHAKLATVEYTYEHAFPQYPSPDHIKQYSLNVDGHGSVCWYNEEALELVNGSELEYEKRAANHKCEPSQVDILLAKCTEELFLIRLKEAFKILGNS